MLSGARVVVVVPAYDVEDRVAQVVATMPAWVDEIVIVDDASHDGTARAVERVGDPRASVIRHARNRGVGAAIVTGYRHALATPGSARDAFAVMAGDGQMDPRDLESVVRPVIAGDVGYVKGDRFAHPDARDMPWTRELGGRVFSAATSLALRTRIRDSQCGYTAIARSACARLDLDALWPRYGYPNDLLAMLVRSDVAIAHVAVRPVYFDGAPGLRFRHLPRIAWIVARAAIRLRS
jgi:glycosyltransferase involved in cell wall biosynthesis